MVWTSDCGSEPTSDLSMADLVRLSTKSIPSSIHSESVHDYRTCVPSCLDFLHHPLKSCKDDPFLSFSDRLFRSTRIPLSSRTIRIHFEDLFDLQAILRHSIVEECCDL